MAAFFSKKDVKQAGSDKSLWDKIRDVALMDVGVMVKGLDTTSIESIEELLLESDFGVRPTLRVIDTMTTEGKKGKLKTDEDYRRLFQQELARTFENVEGTIDLTLAPQPPSVILMTGVNGVGKTTTIAKLANSFQARGKKVILAAGDTFRAGAIEQLERWSERLGCEIVKQKPGADPAAVAYDAVSAAISRQADIVIIDSAGRLHTQDGLMDELAKVRKVIEKRLEGAPHETLLVIDSTTGQNAITQARIFHQRLGVTGIILAKFDGTSKAGCAVAIAEELKIPIKMLGVGEALEDLEQFSPQKYVEKVFS